MITPDIISQLGPTGGDAFNIAFYVMVSMIVLVGIAYLLSRLFRNRQLEDWAKGEFLQTLVSAAIVGGLFTLMAPNTGLIVKAFDSLKPSVLSMDPLNIMGVGGLSSPIIDCTKLGVPQDTVICFSLTYLSLLQLQIMNLMMSILSLNILIDILSKLSIDLIVVQITPLAGLSSVVEVFNSALQSLMFLGIIVEVEMALLQFINSTALTIFLPIGAVLRCFFGTRRLGGALIALSIGMYIVFPLTIALNSVAVDHLKDSAMSNFELFFNDAKELSPLTSFNGTVTSPDAWQTYLSNYMSSATAMMGAVNAIPQVITSAISSLIVEVVFLPALSIILTLIAIKELAGLFGSELNLGRFEI